MNRNMNTLKDSFRAAVRARVPIVMLTTFDPAQTIRTIKDCLNGKQPLPVMLQHDMLNGLQAVIGAHEDSQAISIQIAGDNPPMTTGNPVECLVRLAGYIQNTPEAFRRAVILMHNAHKWISDAAAIQGVWNLRDQLSGIPAMLVLLGVTSSLPPELQHDVVTLEDPLPDKATLAQVVRRLAEDAKAGGCQIEPKTVSQDDNILDTLTGTTAFGAEQAFSMSLTVDSLNMDTLRERKRALVEQTAGLEYWEGAETFDDLGGLENLKAFLCKLFQSGNTPVRAIGFIDEIEKAFSAAGTDTSGTTQDQLQAFLRVMQDDNIPGIVLLGPPGTGKSAIAKASGAAAGCPVISFDLGAMKGSLVGESEARIRAAMAVFKSVSQGKGLFIATCNGIAQLPPELRRRFKLGTFFVDFPNANQRQAIWSIWCKRFGLSATQPKPSAEDWSGAEIAACCEVAFRCGLLLVEAASYIVPVAVSARDRIQALRRAASGAYLSASEPGLYRFGTQAAGQEGGRRAFEFDGERTTPETPERSNTSCHAGQ